MSDTNTDISTADSTVVLSETASTPILPFSSSSPVNTVDDETKRRKILSKLWGKGNKSSHKVRELEKSTINNSSDLSIHNDHNQQQLSDNHPSYSSTNDPKSTTEDNSNSMNSSKPLAVVKPIVVVKSGLIVSSAPDRTRVNSEASSTTTTPIDKATTSATERQSSTITNEKSSKKKKSHKNDDSKKKKATRDKSRERDRSKDRHQHHHHQTAENSSKKSSSSSKNHRRDHQDEVSVNDNRHKSSRDHSSSTTSLSSTKRRSPSNDVDHSNRSRKDESSSAKRSTLSPVDRHHRGSSRTLSPSPSRSRHSTTKHSSSSTKKDDRSSATATKSNRPPTEPVLNSKSTHANSPTDSHSNHRRRISDTTRTDNDSHRQKTRTSDENLTASSKSQKTHESSPPHRSPSSNKQEKSKTITNHEDNRRKLSSSQHDQRSHSRHRSRSKEEKTNRKTIETSNFEENSTNKNKTNHEKDSTTVHESSHHDKKSSRGSSIPSTNDEHRRKSSSDYHRYDRHASPSNYDRRNDYYYHHHHRRRSHYPDTHYVHHHHHHHYRSTSSRYHHHRRSPSPQHRSRYFSSTSSSLSPSPRRRSPSRTSSSSSRTSSSYSTISRTSSSRSSSRNYHHEKKFRRSPTLEKLFLKASESIESVSTQRNPNQSSSTSHLIPVQTSDLQLASPMNSLTEPTTFYAERFSGFSAPPPPFLSQPQQRCLKEITTDSSTSRRLMFNELPSSTSSMIDEVIPMKTIPSNDLSTNVRSGSSRPPRVSRFSDITPAVTSEPALNTNLSVDTILNYAQISENSNCLSSSRRQQKRHNREVMECECLTSEYDRSRGIKACGSECLNRMLLIECSTNCPCGQWCTNRRFQRRSYANHKLALFKTEMKGYGLRTSSSIRKGRFLVEYVGEVVDMDELARRSKKYKRDGNVHQYVMSLIHGTVIDSTIKGNWARFINHSCEPNCLAEKWLVNGEYRMGIFAKRDLNPNEEITIDYRFETFGSADLANEKCYCGAPTCRGTISIKSNNNNNSNKRQNRRQPIDDDELLDCLHDDETNEYIIPKTIEEIRQLIQIMSRTDSENVRSVELDLIRKSSQKHPELPRLFLECNGLHVLCSWMKDILIEDNEQQHYSQEFKYHLLDFMQTVLPIKDRTTVVKNGLLDLVYKKLNLPSLTIENIENNDQEQIQQLINSMLNHLDDPIITKLFHIYSTWMSLKERFIIPKRKESQQASDHHHRRHHHHHSSKYSSDETNYRLSFSTRSSIVQQKPIERFYERRSFGVRDLPRTQEQQLSKDERRKLFEQQYEDEEKARAAATAASANGESPGGQNEPPHKKQRTSDGSDPITSNTPPQSQTSSMSYQDQTYMIHQHLSQIPIDYIRSYMISIGQPISGSSNLIGKDEPPVPPPARPDDETELSQIIRLPSGWSVAMCPSDSSVYFYNQETMTSTWTPPESGTPTENSGAPLDLSPLSSAHITDQGRPHHQQQQSSSRSALKLSKHPHRHNRNHRHYRHHIASNNKRKRPTEMESTTAVIKEEPHPLSTGESSLIIPDERIKEESSDKKLVEPMEDMSAAVPKASVDEDDENDMSTMLKESSELNDHIEEQNTPSNNNTLSSSFKINRDLLRKNISQHVHTILKPYTKRTCKQGRIVSTDDIKYLVKKFTLAVLDKEIEKAKNEGIPLPPILTERVRLKTEVYVKKYMNKMGSVFQRHETTLHGSSQPTTTTNSE